MTVHKTTYKPYLMAAMAMTFFACGATRKQVLRMDSVEDRLAQLETKYQIAASHYDEIERINQLSYAFQDRIEEVELAMAKQKKKILALQARRQRTSRKAVQPVQRSVAPPVALRKGPPLKVADGATAQEVYSRAYRFLKDERYRESETLFNYVLATWPKDDLADNALYWLAEIEYNRKHWMEALKLFESVVQRFPKGNKVPDALLKQSFCWEKLGDRLKSKQVADRLRKEYPWTPAAEKADQTSQEAGGQP